MSISDIVFREDELPDRIRTHPLFPQQVILVLLAISVIVLLPILIWGFPVSSHDGETHIRWQYYYGKQLWVGDWFPRWLTDIPDGFGSPAFFIYPPFSQYVAALLAPLSDSIAWVKHRLAIATILACFLGGGGCFLWLKQITREYNAALIGAVVYMTAPYHLFVDTYYRAAYAELWAFAFAPATLAAIHLLTSRRRIGVALYILGVSGLLMTHAPSAVILMPLFLIYSWTLAAAQRRPSIALWTSIATFSAVLVACAYLGTALTQQSYIHAEGLYDGFYNFYDWLFFNPSPRPKRVFEMVGFLQAAISGLLAGSLLIVKTDRKEWLWLALGAFTGTCFLYFMMTSFSAIVWDLIPFARKIQFPWRLQVAQTLLLALSAALFLRAVTPTLNLKLFSRDVRLSDWIGWLMVVTLIFINLAMLFLSEPKFNIAAPIRTAETPEYTLGDNISGAKYFPGEEKVFVVEGNGSVKLIRWEPRHVEFEINALTKMEMLVKQFTYAGWTCRGSGDDSACRVLSNKTGEILHVVVSPGMQRIRITMPETKEERFGKLASIAGLVIAVISVFAGGMRARVSNKKDKAT